ncbi:AraC family transcriptional regulator [Sphingobacterium sp. ML3W]|uniref:AraC family transcriptional regulator n=1 Tax=Sphingobacterium sp. ML3W TaxID=1538644 RepID=UPI00130EC044|nr:AraC family transcriptional regulator [Sphingobacterium sp. ML3W]
MIYSILSLKLSSTGQIIAIIEEQSQLDLLMKKKQVKNFYEYYKPDRCEQLIYASQIGAVGMKGLSRFDYPGQELPDTVLPGIYSMGYWDAKMDQNWGLDWHRNEGIEFSFMESGNLYFSTEKETVHLHPGSLTITKPWQLHKVGNPKVTVGKQYWIIIDVGVRQPHQEWVWPDWIILSKEDLEYLTKILRENDDLVWQSDKKIQECFLEIGKCLDLAEIEIQHSKLKILINSLLLEILNLFKRGHIEFDQSLTYNLRTVEIFLNHLRSDFVKSWTLEDMAEHCGLGKTSLSKYCKHLTNMTPINYLINIRLEAAAKMLIDREEENVTDLCYDCGFTSSQYFATAFKKRFKCSPSEYRVRFSKEFAVKSSLLSVS